MGKKDKGGKAAAEGAQITLPDGKQVPLTSGVRGMTVMNPAYIKCTETTLSSMKTYALEDKEPFGTSTSAALPKNLNMSKGHFTVAVQNNVYFIKDTSKQGTYILLGKGGKGERIELKKGMIFSVGLLWLKVDSIVTPDGSAPADKKDDLEDDEEYADDDDDEGPATGGAARMIIAGLDKKLKIKCAFSQTGTIGSDKDKNRLVVGVERAASRNVDAVHTRIVVENDCYYLEDAGSAAGTWAGVGKKAFFQVEDGDELLLAKCKCKIVKRPAAFRPLQGFIDMLMGKMGSFDYNVKLCDSKASVKERLDARKGGGA